MTKDEALIDERPDVDVVERKFSSNRIKGLYCNGTVAISSNIDTSIERACVLAEEFGHHDTTVGDIIDMKKSSSRKQENAARLIGYNKLIGLQGIIDAFEHHCNGIHESSEFLGVTEEFLLDAIKAYSNRYGNYVTYKDYLIIFNYPNVGVIKQI